MEFITELVVNVPIEQMKSVEAGMIQIKKLIAEKVDAIICVNDYMAAVVIKCLQKLKINIPEDIAVIGCDNMDIATLITPELTTFEQHNDQVAIHLVDMMIAQIEGQELPPEQRHIVVKPTLIVRESA